VYRLIVETMQEATLTVAPEGLILWCNPQFANLLQSPAGQILGKPLQMFVNPDQHPRIDALLEQIRDAPVRERVVFRAADGTPVPAYVDANRLLQPEGTIICLVVSTLGWNRPLTSPDDSTRESRAGSPARVARKREQVRPVIPDNAYSSSRLICSTVGLKLPVLQNNLPVSVGPDRRPGPANAAMARAKVALPARSPCQASPC
jgi:PAS domain S-box-containing protein